MTEHAIQHIESELELSLPTDFKFLLMNLRDPGHVFFPWSSFSLAAYHERIDRIWQGIEFDIEHGFWMERWGEKPGDLEKAKKLAKPDFESWPAMLPLLGHRFLPASPCQANNPVFSIMQTDIIYYGATLADYLLRELTFALPIVAPIEPFRRIDVWSDLAEGDEEWD